MEFSAVIRTLNVLCLVMIRQTLSLSVRFSGHFPGGPGLAGPRMSPFWILLELRVTEVMVTTGAIRRAKLQSKCHHQQTNSQFFYRPDALPVAQPTASEH